MESQADEIVNAYTTRVQLPSRGVRYGERMKGGWVEVNPMTAAEEKLLANRLLARYQIMNTILSRCLVSSPVPLTEWLAADRTFLMMAVRNVTYGPHYEFPLQCQRCERTWSHSVDLPSGLEMRALTKDDLEPFFVTLPMSKKRVGLRLLRVKDQDEISARSGGRGEATTVDLGDQYVMTMARHIVEVDGQPVREPGVLEFYESLLGGDAATLRKAVRENECGVDLRIQTTCGGCGASIKQMMPFTAEFFLPSDVSVRPPVLPQSTGQAGGVDSDGSEPVVQGD